MPTLRQHTDALAAALHPIYDRPEAEAIAGQVLEHLLHLTPLQRRMQGQQQVDSAQIEALSGIQMRLLQYEPLQYVLGVAHFDGLELEVTPATLIPRPETEELVALIAREQPQQPGLRVLDVGTGSGCIPLALAQRMPAAVFTAVDISEAALAVARRNAARYGAIIDFQCLDILREQPVLAAPVQVLVSNPPYVLENERPLMRPNVLQYEPSTALFVPDNDPLLFYRRIAELGCRLLAANGALYFEINEQFARETTALLLQMGYGSVVALPDIFGKYRMVRATWLGGA